MADDPGETRHPRCGLSHDRCKQGEDVVPGDVVLFFGTPHVVRSIDPYTGPFDFICGVARAADGWGVSLSPGHCVEVA